MYRISLRRISQGLTQIPSSRGLKILKDSLQPIVKRKRIELKSLKQDYGKNVLGKVTLNQCIDGSHYIPVIFSQHSHDESRSKLIDNFYNTSSEHTSHYLFEAFLWYLLTKQHPTEIELESLVIHLQQRKYSLPSSIFTNLMNILSILPTNYNKTRLLSITMLCLQPNSHFFHGRRDLLKAQHWELILEDILDIIAIFPELLNIIHNHTKENTISSESKEFKFLPQRPSYVEVIDSIRPEKVKDGSILKFIENVISDGGHPIVHTMRLVGCTLSDPYLATSSAIQAYDEDQRDELFSEGRYYRLTAGLIGGLIELFWDRALMLPLENPKSIDWAFAHEQLKIPFKPIITHEQHDYDNNEAK